MDTHEDPAANLMEEQPEQTLLQNYIQDVINEGQTVDFMSVPSLVHADLTVIAFSPLNDRLLVDKETQEVLFSEAGTQQLVSLTDAGDIDDFIAGLQMAKTLLEQVSDIED